MASRSELSKPKVGTALTSSSSNFCDSAHDSPASLGLFFTVPRNVSLDHEGQVRPTIAGTITRMDVRGGHVERLVERGVTLLKDLQISLRRARIRDDSTQPFWVLRILGGLLDVIA